jgi:UDP-glucose 4-epimerase
VLVASSDKIRKALGWVPEKPSLEAMVGDAWAWIQANRDRHG